MSSKHSWLCGAACVLVVGLFGLSSCGSGGADCEDGTDNDGDGLIDGEDLACREGREAEAPDPVVPLCADALDNDEDGFIDNLDPGCANPTDDDELNAPVAACNDGVDNDSDGPADYPDDPGCSLSLDDDETDTCPDGAECPQCANGMDDDNDGNADYPTDIGCDSSGDADEYNSTSGACGAAPIQVLPEGGIATGTIETNGINALQTSACLAGGGSEVVYQFDIVGDPRKATFTTDFPETELDTVLYLRTTCQDPQSELGCNDDVSDLTFSSRLVVAELAAGTYFLVVDAHDNASQGAYKLAVGFSSP
jgi:hypothetical protein